MVTLHLIRHTSVTGTTGLCYGRTDVQLSSSFQEEAAAVRSTLPPRPYAVWSSPSTRCLRLAETFGAAIHVDERLRELDMGDWDGRAWSELRREATEYWLADHFNRRPPGGETFAELLARASAAITGIAAHHSSGSILVVTHAGVIRALLARATGRPLHDAFSIPVPFGSMHTLRQPPTPLDDFASVGAPHSIFP
jgi:alpha-ribazole phosphatase